MLLEGAHAQQQGNTMFESGMRMSCILQYVMLCRMGLAHGSGASDTAATASATASAEAEANLLLQHVLLLLAPHMLALEASCSSSSSQVGGGQQCAGADAAGETVGPSVSDCSLLFFPGLTEAVINYGEAAHHWH
jgi:hypothetical protein